MVGSRPSPAALIVPALLLLIRPSPVEDGKCEKDRTKRFLLWIWIFRIDPLHVEANERTSPTD